MSLTHGGPQWWTLTLKVCHADVFTTLSTRATIKRQTAEGPFGLRSNFQLFSHNYRFTGAEKLNCWRKLMKRICLLLSIFFSVTIAELKLKSVLFDMLWRSTNAVFGEMFTEQVTLKAIVQRIYYLKPLTKLSYFCIVFLSNKAHISLGKTRDLWYGF